MVGAFLGELLEMDVLDSFSENWNPMFRMLEEHDVARVEMNPHEFAVERIDEGVHLHRSHGESIEEDVFHVEMNTQFFCGGEQLANGLAGAVVTNVITNGLVIVPPRNVNRTGNDQQVFGA